MTSPRSRSPRTTGPRTTGPQLARSGRTWRTALAVALATGLVVAGCGDDGGPERDDDGALVEPGPIDPYHLQVGDCVDHPEGQLEDAPTEATEVSAVDCAEPHDIEVFALVEVPGDDDAYPGAEEIQREGGARCASQLGAYIGSDPLVPVEVIAYLFPSEDSWEQGDRQVVCALYGAETPKLIGSMAAG